jgi:hypothetical protein
MSDLNSMLKASLEKMKYARDRVLARQTVYRDEFGHLAYGICDLVFSASVQSRTSATSRDTAMDMLRDVFRSWEHFSGDINYPVQHEDLNPTAAFYQAVSHERRWHTGQYAQRRAELLNLCIEHFEKTLAVGDAT